MFVFIKRPGVIPQKRTEARSEKISCLGRGLRGARELQCRISDHIVFFLMLAFRVLIRGTFKSEGSATFYLWVCRQKTNLLNSLNLIMISIVKIVIVWSY